MESFYHEVIASFLNKAMPILLPEQISKKAPQASPELRELHRQEVDTLLETALELFDTDHGDQKIASLLEEQPPQILAAYVDRFWAVIHLYKEAKKSGHKTEIPQDHFFEQRERLFRTLLQLPTP